MVRFRTEGEVKKEKKYSEYTWMEKLLPPILNWMVRKVFLALCVVLLTVCKLVANRFRFSIEANVSDRAEWVWLDNISVPILKMDRKKVKTKSE